MAAGLKYNLYRDPNAGRLLSVGMSFEAPWGSTRSLQGNGDGEFHFFATGATANWHAITLDQCCWPSTADRRSRRESRDAWSNHFDYRLGRRPLYAFTEVNWFHYLSDGAAFPPIEGVTFSILAQSV